MMNHEFDIWTKEDIQNPRITRGKDVKVYVDGKLVGTAQTINIEKDEEIRPLGKLDKKE